MILLSLLLALSQDPKAPAREPAWIAGEFVRADARTILVGISVQGRAVIHLFGLDAEVEVVIDGQKAKLDGLRPGRAVRLVFKGPLVGRVETPGGGKPASKPPEPKAPEPPFPIDDSILSKGEKLPDLGGRVLTVFRDGSTTLVTIKQGNEEIPVYLPKGAAVTYVGLEKPDQKPTAGYLAYVWLRSDAKDTAATVRFGRGK